MFLGSPAFCSLLLTPPALRLDKLRRQANQISTGRFRPDSISLRNVYSMLRTRQTAGLDRPSRTDHDRMCYRELVDRRWRSTFINPQHPKKPLRSREGRG